MWPGTHFRRIALILLMCLLAALVAALIPITSSYASNDTTKPPAKPTATAISTRPTASLNRTQGPLGVTLTLSGKHFPPGQATLSYIDAANVPGIFMPPSDTAVEVIAAGAFLTTNLVLPASGPAGDWKIVVTDSTGALYTITYHALAAPGQTTAYAPSLSLDLSNETTNGTIAFTGTNWLPKGTSVKLTLNGGAVSIPLLEPGPVSDIEGNISGVFHLPTNLTASNATIVASDLETNTLRAQVPISLTNGIAALSSPTPTTPVDLTTPTASTSIASTGNSGSITTSDLLGKIDVSIWEPVLLVTSVILGIAGLMLILFMIPWSRGDKKSSSRQYRQP